MKRQQLFPISGAIAFLFLLSSCGQDSHQNPSAARKSPGTQEHYIATYEGDTAVLTMTRRVSLMEGKLKFLRKTGVVDSGALQGRIVGDTIYADYHSRAANGTWYRNPIALLHRDQKLYLGVGRFEMAWGRTYFAKNTAIDYQKGKYVFAQGPR